MRKNMYVSMTAFVILISAFALKAQNLVPNPSFETHATCPSNNIFTAADWYNPNTASPDYFNPCGSGWTVPGPNMLFGHQMPRTGTSLAGAGWYGLGGGWYDYMQVKLTAPMVAGEIYNVSMWVILAKGVSTASDDIGIYISTEQFKSSTNILPSISTIIPTTPVNFGVFTTLTPQIKTADGQFVTDTANWTQVSGLYTATGGEQVITIGCFEPWASTGVLVVNPAGNGRCYYLFDDVSVEKIATAPTQPGTISGLQTVCENSTQTFSIDSVPGAISYTWTLPNGWSGTSSTNSITATVGADDGNITVTANNASGSSIPQTLAVTVNTFPGNPGTITGPLSVCTSLSVDYFVSGVTGATSYSWTIPLGWLGNSSDTNLTLIAGTSGGTLIVHAQNECGTSGSQVEIVVENPNANVTINNNQLVAANNQDSYQWTDCNNNYNNISGETQSIFSPEISGEYAVIVTKNGCTDTSTCYTIEKMSITESQTSFSVYPNPVVDNIYITLEEISISEVKYSLVDLSGKIIQSGINNTFGHTINIRVNPQVKDGMYLLQIRTNDAIFQQKIIVKK